MKRSALRGTLVAAVVALASPALAQGGAGAGPGPGGRGPAHRVFDPATVTTVSGRIEAIETVQHRRGQGVHAVLATADGAVDVHLGPARYLDAQPVKLEKGDAVEVTGSKVQIRGKPAIVAQVVNKGSATLKLRDASGVPAWRGQRTR